MRLVVPILVVNQVPEAVVQIFDLVLAPEVVILIFNLVLVREVVILIVDLVLDWELDRRASLVNLKAAIRQELQWKLLASEVMFVLIRYSTLAHFLQ